MRAEIILKLTIHVLALILYQVFAQLDSGDEYEFPVNVKRLEDDMATTKAISTSPENYRDRNYSDLPQIEAEPIFDEKSSSTLLADNTPSATVTNDDREIYERSASNPVSEAINIVESPAYNDVTKVNEMKSNIPMGLFGDMTTELKSKEKLSSTTEDETLVNADIAISEELLNEFQTETTDLKYASPPQSSEDIDITSSENSIDDTFSATSTGKEYGDGTSDRREVVADSEEDLFQTTVMQANTIYGDTSSDVYLPDSLFEYEQNGTETSSIFFENETYVEVNGTDNITSDLLLSTTKKPSAVQAHLCLNDIDESESEMHRYVCAGNKYASIVATAFLLTMILFAVTKNISTYGFMQLLDVRRPGVSFPQRPEMFVLLCSTLPLIFATIARPIFWPYAPRYQQFINNLGFMQARLFFDLFTRTASVYHLVFWAYRMPIIRWMWKSYLRFKAFQQVWTKEHIIEVLREKFSPAKEIKMRRGFQNTPEYMYTYAQFLQSGMPMQYFQYIPKSGGPSPTSMSNVGLDGFQFMPQGSVHGGPGKYSSSQYKADQRNELSQRTNLNSLMGPGSESSSPKVANASSFLGSSSNASPSVSRYHGSQPHHPANLPLTRGGSFRSSQSSKLVQPPFSNPEHLAMGIDRNFGQYLAPEDAIQASREFVRPANMLYDSYNAENQQNRLPMFPGQDFYPSMLPAYEGLEIKEKKPEEAVKIPPPTREFTYICKHAIPGSIYIIALIVTFPAIFGFDTYEYESSLTKFYLFYDMIIVVTLPMVAIIAAFYHGALAEVQMNGGTKMHFRLRCYYVNFVILSIPMLILMMTAAAYRLSNSREMESERYGTGTIVAFTAYHLNFVLKSTVYTTGCNCICCGASCLKRYPRFNKCLVNMTTPRVKAEFVDTYSSGAVIPIAETEKE